MLAVSAAGGVADLAPPLQTQGTRRQHCRPDHGTIHLYIFRCAVQIPLQHGRKYPTGKRQGDVLRLGLVVLHRLPASGFFDCFGTLQGAFEQRHLFRCERVKHCVITQCLEKLHCLKAVSAEQGGVAEGFQLFGNGCG